MNCAHPINWGNCWPPHELLIPYVHDYVDSRRPYAKERGILESLEQSDGLGRLDGGRAKP